MNQYAQELVLRQWRKQKFRAEALAERVKGLDILVDLREIELAQYRDRIKDLEHTVTALNAYINVMETHDIPF